jgi:hypothetical protein
LTKSAAPEKLVAADMPFTFAAAGWLIKAWRYDWIVSTSWEVEQLREVISNDNII